MVRDGLLCLQAAQSLVPEIAGDTDDRDWRSRSALPEAPPGSGASAPDAPRRPPSEPSARVRCANLILALILILD